MKAVAILRSPALLSRCIDAIIRYAAPRLAPYAGCRITRSLAKELLRPAASMARTRINTLIRVLELMGLLHPAKGYVYVPIVWQEDLRPVLMGILRGWCLKEEENEGGNEVQKDEQEAQGEDGQGVRYAPRRCR